MVGRGGSRVVLAVGGGPSRPPAGLSGSSTCTGATTLGGVAEGTFVVWRPIVSVIRLGPGGDEQVGHTVGSHHG